MTLRSFEEPKRVKITFRFDGIRSQVKAEGICEVQLEPIRNPVTGKVHLAILEFPSGGFESTRMDMASSSTLFVKDELFDFKYEGSYGSIQEISWKGIGP